MNTNEQQITDRLARTLEGVAGFATQIGETQAACRDALNLVRHQAEQIDHLRKRVAELEEIEKQSHEKDARITHLERELKEWAVSHPEAIKQKRAELELEQAKAQAKARQIEDQIKQLQVKDESRGQS